MFASISEYCTGDGSVTKEEYSRRFLELNRELRDREREIEEKFWATHGGRPKGKGEVPRHLFAAATAEFIEKWRKLKDEYGNS